MDFLINEENLQLLRDSGCFFLFSGVESFDNNSLAILGKQQIAKVSQSDLIARCINYQIAFIYGLMFDIYNRTIYDIQEEIDFLFNTSILPLPAFCSLPIPLLGTPNFRKSMKNKQFLPNVKIRDFDGTTLLLKPVDPLNEVVKFMYQLQYKENLWKKALKHQLKFVFLHRNELKYESMFLSLLSGHMGIPRFLVLGADWRSLHKRWFSFKRTFIPETEPLDDFYRPKFRIESKYEDYFQPTILTNSDGELNENLYDDLFEC